MNDDLMYISALHLALLVLSSPVVSVAQSDNECSEPDTTISGSVSAGEAFEARFSDDLIFVLQPETHPKNPAGWRIQVSDSVGGNDFLMVATPPYRSSNPRYLDTSYGTSAANAVAWTPRTFRFVLNDEDYETMHTALSALLWPGDKIEAEIEVARQIMASIKKGAGTFRITASETSQPGEDAPLGRIESLAFAVDLCAATIDVGGD